VRRFFVGHVYVVGLQRERERETAKWTEEADKKRSTGLLVILAEGGMRRHGALREAQRFFTPT